MTRLKDTIAEMASFVAAIEEGFEAQDKAMTEAAATPGMTVKQDPHALRADDASPGPADTAGGSQDIPRPGRD